MNLGASGFARRIALGALAGLLFSAGAHGAEPWQFSSEESKSKALEQCEGDYREAYEEAEAYLKELAKGKADAADQALQCLRASIALLESSGETKPPRKYTPYFHLAVLFDARKQYADAKKCLERERSLEYVQNDRKLGPQLRALESRLREFTEVSEWKRAIDELRRWKEDAHAMSLSQKSLDALSSLETRASAAGGQHAETIRILGQGIDGVLQEEFLRRQTELEAVGASSLIADLDKKQSQKDDLSKCTGYDPSREAAVASLKKCDSSLERVRGAAVRSACGKFGDGPRPPVCEEAARVWPGIVRLAEAATWKPPEKPKEKPKDTAKKETEVAQADLDATTTPVEPPAPVVRASEGLRRRLLEAFTTYQAGALDQAIEQARRLLGGATGEPVRGRAFAHATLSFFLFAKGMAYSAEGGDVKAWLAEDAKQNALQAAALEPGFQPPPALFPKSFLDVFTDWTRGVQ